MTNELKPDEKTDQCEKGHIMNENTLRAVGVIGIAGIYGVFVVGIYKVVKLVLNK